MSKKQWYVFIEVKETVNNLNVFYVQNKKAAMELNNQLKNNNSIQLTYIDFVWKEDIKNNIPFHQLHGKSINKLDSIDYLINKVV